MNEAHTPPKSASAQLIYTSFDDGAGRGGWQVKQTAGELTQTQRDALVGRVITRFDLEPRLPDFPSADQIAARPSRLSYAPLDDAGAYWHTTAAGPDASGRPGNVFAHIAVDRAPSVRPITRWGSADWLRPYGPAEVNGATLSGPEPPRPNPDMSARSTVAFLTDLHADRQGVFRVLLDAVAEAVDGGLPVALLTASHQASAAWIAAVSYFLPLPMTHRFAWSTHDRPDQVSVAIERGHHLIAVPADTVDDRTRIPGALVIAETEMPGLADVGGSHHVTRGEVVATPLSSFVEGILEDPDVALAVLERRDQVAAAIADGGMAASWPLAVAVAENPQLEEFADDALRVVALEAPPGIDDLAWVTGLLARAYARHPLTPADTLHPLLRLSRLHQDTTMAATRFLTAVLHDQHWLDSEPLNTVPPVQSVDLGALEPVIAERVEASGDDADPTLSSTRLVRLTVLLYRLGRRDAGFARVRDLLAGAWEAIDVSVIWDSRRNAGLRDVAISPTIRAELLRPVLLRWQPSWRDRISGSLWAWIFDDGSPSPLAPPANPSETDLTLYPLAVRASLADPDFADVTARRTAVTAAIEFALADPALDDAACRALTDTLISQERPETATMLSWTQRHPQRTSPAMLHSQVFYDPIDLPLLSDLARQRPADTDTSLRALVAAARLRLAVHEKQHWPATPAELDATVLACLSDPTRWDYRLAEDLTTMLHVGVLVAQSRDIPLVTASGDVTQKLGNQQPRSLNGLESLLQFAVQRELLDLGWVAARSFLARVGTPHPQPVIIDRFDPPGPDPDVPGWTDRLLGWAIDDGCYRGPVTTAELRDAVWPVVRGGHAADAEEFFTEYESRAKDWRKEFRLGDSEVSAGRSMLGRFTREDH